MTYDEALEYIHSVSWKGSRPGLERIAKLCSLLGNPENDLRFIHVAGTNGKGSVCCMLSGILLGSGYRTGLFTSPFVDCFNERIMFDGREISDKELAETTEYVKQFADTMEDSPTEFELITAVAFVYFKKMKCDFVVLEAGLGGRLDSTNVINTSVLSVITGIDLDHMAVLGETTAKIAAEKAGIIKMGTPVLFGEGDSSAEEVIRNAAERNGSPYFRTDFSKISDVKSNLDGTTFSFDGVTYKMKLLGMYQTRNAATVLSAVAILREYGILISEEAVADGISAAIWKARFEILSCEPLVIYDGAHNPHGIRGAVENIKYYLSKMTSDGRVALLMGVMADKEHLKMIENLSSVAAYVYCVTPNNARSLNSSEVCAEFNNFGITSSFYEDLRLGVESACRYASEAKIPLVCLGSLYMYADVKRAVRDYFDRTK